MKNSLITDSGFWIALFHRNDSYHAIAADALNKYADYGFLVTWPVLVEVSHLLHQRAGYPQQLEFISSVQRGGAFVFHMNADSHLFRATELIKKYRDLPMDLADASLVILAEELGHGRILSTDQRDFNAYRWKNHKPFENLLLSEG